MSLYDNLGYSISPDVLPQQSVPLAKKLEEPTTEGEKSWSQQCMDSLERIGRSQFNSNLRLVENYEMIKGRFIYDHYFHTEGYTDVMSQLNAEMQMPSYLRHYDIISQVVNTMSGEWQKRPDTFSVRQIGDDASAEYLRTKMEMTVQMVTTKINNEINQKLVQQGIDPARTDFNSPEEQQQYQQQIAQLKQQMTPTDIQKYMDTDFLTIAEVWGQHQREFDKEFFNLPEKEKVEFEDMLVADRCFRHFYVAPDGYKQETWNPVNTFFNKSPDIVPIEDGDFVGRIFNISINTIIDRYGSKLKKEDFDLLYDRQNKDKNTKWDDSKFNWVYDNYMFPFKDYETYDIMRASWNKPYDSNTLIPQATGSIFGGNSGSLLDGRPGYYFVTEAYWKTQKKLYKLTYFDPELQQIVVDIVDENVKIPKRFKESARVFDDDHDIDTYCVTEVNEVWKGIKISTGADKKLKRDIYLDIGPNDFQFKGDRDLYGCRLPVCGQVFSVRNSRSMSLVDMMKPYQIGYNVCMNQIYQLMEKEIGMFVIMDVNMLPNSKDWGGEDAWSKWMLIAKATGLLPADTKPTNIQGALAASGGFLPKIIDLNLAAQMVSRVNLAKFFEEQALKQVGFNQYRTGNFASTSTATGVQQGSQQSYNNTESYFTNFSNYLRRAAQMSLDIAQFVQCTKPEIPINYIKSDFSRAFAIVKGTDLILPQLGVFVTNSQEVLRQLEMMRQYALENNTAGMTPPDVADTILMNSPKEIRNQLKKSYERVMQQQEQMQQAQQQAQQAALQLQQQQLATEHQEFEDKLQNNLDVQQLRSGAQILSQGGDNSAVESDSNFTNQLKQQTLDNQQATQQQSQTLKERQQQHKENYDQQKLDLENRKLDTDLQVQNMETETARIQKGIDRKPSNNNT
jgi:hypothetical protein